MAARYKTIPDLAFRNFLQGEIPEAFNEQSKLNLSHEAVRKMVDLDIPPGNIVSLEGIQFFTALTGLVCEKNKLERLDLRNNVTLRRVWCAGNRLQTLQLTQSPYLQTLDCSDNRLRELDLAENTTLRLLHCQRNDLRQVDISCAPGIVWLTLGGGENVDGVIKNPLRSLKINQTLQRREEIAEAVRNCPYLTISTHHHNGAICCADYDPMANRCRPALRIASRRV